MSEELVVKDKFCQLEDIEKEGFVYPDGSLKFEIEIKKQNYRKKLIEAEEKVKMLEKRLERIEMTVEVFDLPGHQPKNLLRDNDEPCMDRPFLRCQPVEKIKVGTKRARDFNNVANDLRLDPLVASNSPAKRKR